MPDALLKGITLRGLEVFETLARTGSVTATADHLGMSAPAVSQQIKALSHAVGTELVDHSRRPMVLTPAGRMFLTRAETALQALRVGHRGLASLDLSALSALSLGVIEDFENEVTPILAARLAEGMQSCAFRLQTGPSHTLHGRIARRELDVAICAAGNADPGATTLHPLLQDPYVLAVPQGMAVDAGLGSLSGLAFLRRDLDQIMGQQIERFIARAGLTLPQRFEMDSNQSISALVANGVGWTITTPLSLLRAGRFAGGIDVHALPGAPMARQIVLYATDDWSDDIPAQIAGIARDLIDTHFVIPGQDRMPWLGDSFGLRG
jgi:DNA-binding transcriptional LysR family regulator